MSYRSAGKRALDFALASVLLIVSAPVQVAIAFGCRWMQGRPVLFRQERAGRNGEPFTLYKFRTMRHGIESPSNRVTPLGRALRKSSLDELPQLLNILVGDMSFVGPRPLHMRYNTRYDERQRRRLDVRPGLTGLAQIQGRNAVSWQERFEWDVRYLERVTFRRDLDILRRTVGVVLRGLVGVRGDATMPSHEFLGSNPDGAPSP